MSPTASQNSPNIDPEKLSAEHALLVRKQYEALQKSSYLKMSVEDADSYDRRRLRIGEICELLVQFRALKSWP